MVGDHEGMPFLNGAVTYARFAVTGEAPEVLDQSIIDAFAANPAKPTPIGVPNGPETGWTGGRHILDNTFEFNTMCFDGWVHAAMRLDIVRVPPEVKRAYVAVAEASRTNALEPDQPGWLSRAARKEAREEAKEQWEREVSDGRHRSSKLVPILWNPSRRILLSPATTDSVAAPLRDLFTATFGGRLEQRSAGSLAVDLLATRGLLTDFEDARPDNLGQQPPSGGSGIPEVPWASGGSEPKDFLGNSFLMWLWWRGDVNEGLFDLADGTNISVALDRSIESECGWGITGRQSLNGNTPSRWAEASIATLSGKLPRRIGLVVSDGVQEWNCSLQGDRFVVSGLRLPRSEEPAETPQEAALERIGSISSFDSAMTDLYSVFLDERFSSRWSVSRSKIAEWISQRSRPRSGFANESMLKADTSATVPVHSD
jgi:hypothetical protein